MDFGVSRTCLHACSSRWCSLKCEDRNCRESCRLHSSPFCPININQVSSMGTLACSKPIDLQIWMNFSKSRTLNIYNSILLSLHRSHYLNESINKSQHWIYPTLESDVMNGQSFTWWAEMVWFVKATGVGKNIRQVSQGSHSLETDSKCSLFAC